MTPGYRPPIVMCAGCGTDRPAATCREAVLVWSLTNKSRDGRATGTLTNPRFVKRLDVFICESCQVGAFENTQEIRELLGRIANVCRMLAQFMAPKRFAGVKHRPSARQESLAIDVEKKGA